MEIDLAFIYVNLENFGTGIFGITFLKTPIQSLHSVHGSSIMIIRTIFRITLYEAMNELFHDVFLKDQSEYLLAICQDLKMWIF